MSEIKREQLCILTILGHVKTGVKIVKCNWQIIMNFLNYAMNDFNKKMLLLFQTIIQLHRKNIDKMTYIN